MAAAQGNIYWKKIRKSGRAIVITTLTQSLGTFLVVSLVFGIAVLNFMLIGMAFSAAFSNMVSESGWNRLCGRSILCWDWQ